MTAASEQGSWIGIHSVNTVDKISRHIVKTNDKNGANCSTSNKKFDENIKIIEDKKPITFYCLKIWSKIQTRYKQTLGNPYNVAICDVYEMSVQWKIYN